MVSEKMFRCSISFEVSSRRFQFTAQPRQPELPVSPNGDLGHSHRLGDLFNGEATEDSQFDDPALTGLKLSQAFKSFIQSNQVHALTPIAQDRSIESPSFCGPAALLRTRCSRIVYENAPHHLSADRKEMAAILPLHILPIHQPNERFV